MSNDTLPNVVVVGVGSAGARAAHLFTKKLDTAKFNLVVVNPRPDYILYPATARLVVSDRDHIREKVFVPIENILKGKGRFIQGKVVKVEPGKEGGGLVAISNGETIPYHVLILSPGVSWENPFGFPEGSDDLDGYLNPNRQAIEKASSIVLVGAGAVGCEIAGELKDIFPEKKITIVHGDSLPLNGTYPAKYRGAVRKSLEARNIEFVLEDYIDDIPSLGSEVTETTTRNGKTIQADLVISTRGQRPNTELFVESFGQESLTSRGLVKVEATLQLPGHKDIFVIGDVIDWDEQKQSIKAQAHADIAVANVLSQLKGQMKLKKYTGTLEMIFLTNGRNGGLSYIKLFGGITFGNRFTRTAKSKSLIIPLQRGAVGVQ
ncbi:FAD/NAD(P)-binding domain-containing protein [Macrolepiota fuliginosa MF-IS2]|uniref:FAD/NAD(P)-binding domain-containing protein n=1 Tax=Macrolepiota fuliginosa MF-IS2 TaxID=1400762 RepID=A0A9P6C9M2_9AGAR|nr:FAD/NAD(P)-binding domain-containing protein [Macrolepiota fuliginosa MF-IS2]